MKRETLLPTMWPNIFRNSISTRITSLLYPPTAHFEILIPSYYQCPLITASRFDGQASSMEIERLPATRVSVERPPTENFRNALRVGKFSSRLHSARLITLTAIFSGSYWITIMKYRTTNTTVPLLFPRARSDYDWTWFGRWNRADALFQRRDGIEADWIGYK